MASEEEEALGKPDVSSQPLPYFSLEKEMIILTWDECVKCPQPVIDSTAEANCAPAPTPAPSGHQGTPPCPSGEMLRHRIREIRKRDPFEVIRKEISV